MLATILWIAPLALVAVSPSRAAAGAYTVTNLGTLGGDNSYASAINDAGRIVGAADTLTTGVDGFVYRDGNMWDLGESVDKATAINEAGQIVGWDDADGMQAFLSTAGYLQRLGDFMPASYMHVFNHASRAYAVNHSGQVVGRAMLPLWIGNLPVYHAFLRANRAMQDLGVLGGGYGHSEARAVNDSGQVAGWSEIVLGLEPFPRQPNDIHAFLRADGTMQDLGTLGGNFSCAFGLNAAGTVVGVAATADGRLHAFVRTDGAMRDLGSFVRKNSAAHAINTAGDIVGTAWDDAADGRITEQCAFVYRDGKLQDLNLLAGSAALSGAGLRVLVRALGLNDRGQIVGEARDLAGHTLAFLLTPVDGTAPARPPVTPPPNTAAVGKGLHFIAGPADGAGVVTDHYRRERPSAFADQFDLVELDALQVRPPLAIYDVNPDDISQGIGLKNATTSGKVYSYCTEISGQAQAQVLVSLSEGGKTTDRPREPGSSLRHP